MNNIRRFLREFLVSLVISLMIVGGLTVLADMSASNLSPETPKILRAWIKQNPWSRFDDWMDGIVLANVLYKTVNPNHSLWTYFLPSDAPQAGKDLLEYVLSPQNHQTLAASIDERRGELLHRYWTGHIALTALALYVYKNPVMASKFSLGCVLFSAFLYMFAWARRLGFDAAVGVAVILLGTGALYMESFHTHAWGPAVAFGTGAFLATRLDRGSSCVAPAVIGAVFANWVGYDYVFPTIAFSLPVFAFRRNGNLETDGLAGPLKFTCVFLAVTALMMFLRVPVAYFFENCTPWEFLDKLKQIVAYRVDGELSAQEALQSTQISREIAVLSALRAVNTYLYQLGGRFIPLIRSAEGYVLFQILPIAALALILAVRNRESLATGLKPVIVFAGSLLFFHIMLLVLVNHACVHPWMHARYMVFALAVSWGSVISAIGLGGCCVTQCFRGNVPLKRSIGMNLTGGNQRK